QRAGVADLAAALGIERGAVENDDCRLALPDRLDRAAVAQQRDHLGAARGELFVAEEFRRRQLRDQLGRQAGAAAELAGAARAFALLFHQVLVVLHRRRLELRATLAQDVGDQVRRAAVGVVELEQVFAVDRKSTRLNSSHVKISYAVFCLKKKTGSTLAACAGVMAG